MALSNKCRIEDVFKSNSSLHSLSDLSTTNNFIKLISNDDITREYRMIKNRSFNIGGINRTVTTDQIIKKIVIRKYRESKDAPEIEIETEKEIPLKEIESIKDRVGHHYTWMKGVEAKKDVQFEGLFTGTWRGSYRDLRREYLEVQVCAYEMFSPNSVLGTKKISLKDAAEGSNYQDIDVLKSRQNIGTVRFKFEFEEIYDYRLDFKDWNVSSTFSKNGKKDLKYVISLTAASYESDFFFKDSIINFFYRYPFRGKTPMVVSPLSLLLTVGNTPPITFVHPFFKPEFHTIEFNVGGDKESVLNRVEMPERYFHFQGTRSELEDEILKINVFQRTHPLAPRQETYHASVAMQGVMDFGTLQTTLNKMEEPEALEIFKPANEEDGLPMKAMKSVARTLCCCFALLDSQSVVDGMQVKGNVSFARNAKPFHSQYGITGGDTIIPSREGKNFVKLKVFSAKNLHPLDGKFRECINPSVSAEWNGIVRETNIIFDETSPSFSQVFEYCVVALDSPISNKLYLQSWHNDGFSKSSLGSAVIDLVDLINGLMHGVKEEEMIQKDPPPKLYHFTVKLDDSANSSSKGDDDEEKKQEAAAENEKQHGSLAAATLTVQIYIDFEVINKMILQADNAKAISTVAVPSTEFNNAFHSFQKMTQHVRSRNDNRFFLSYGRDERTSRLQFLPTFLHPISPPFELVNENKNGAIFTRPLRDCLEQIFNFVCSIECSRKELNDFIQLQHRLLSNANSTPQEIARAKNALAESRIFPNSRFEYEPTITDWADPYHFMTKLRGDFKDHAILLCNFFLDLGIQAFVCLGTAKRAASQEKISEPHVWVMTKHYSIPKRGEKIGNTEYVTFWEISDGKAYELDRIVAMSPAGPNPNGDVDEEKEVLKIKLATSQAATALKKPVFIHHAEELLNDDMDEIVDELQEPIGSEPFGDDIEEKINDHSDVAKFDFFEAHMSEDQKMKISKRNAELARINALTVNFQNPTVDQSVMPRYYVSLPRFYREKIFGRSKKFEQKKIPYASIDVVFNNRKLYGNLQLPDPTKINYDFNDPNRWAAFPIEDSQPFYNQKSMRMKATVKQIRDKNIDLTKSLQNGWEQTRNLDYGFISVFYEDNEQIIERLEIEQDYGLYTLDDAEIDNFTDVPPIYRPEPKGFTHISTLKAKRNEWSANLLKRLPDGCQYKEKFFLFRHSDPTRIVESVISQCHNTDFLNCPEFLNPYFCIGVLVHRLPASVCATRVVVACVSFNPEAIVR